MTNDSFDDEFFMLVASDDILTQYLLKISAANADNIHIYGYRLGTIARIYTVTTDNIMEKSMSVRMTKVFN